MEKDFDKTEKKTTGDDDDKLISNNSSKKSKNNENDENANKRTRPASFFVVSSGGEVSEEKSKDKKPDNHEEDNTSSEDMNEDEVSEVVQIIIDEREQAVADELVSAPESSAEELEAVAAGLFLESLRHTALSENEITVESIERAYEESLDDLDMTSEVTEPTESILDELDNPEQATSTDILNSENINSTPTNIVSHAATNPLAFPPPPTINTRNSAGPINNLPVGATTSRPSQQNNRKNRNIIPVPIPVPLDSSTALLVGSITGYIIGRRGNRSSQVNNSLPNYKKLENQVLQIQKTIYKKETELRVLVRESSQKSVITSDKPLFIAERRKKRTQIKEELRRREELANNPKVEKIGNFSLPALKIYRERRLPDGTENTPKRKPVEIMTVQELLDKSGRVKYEKWTIEELFKAHRITEKTLRQVTKEYMRDGPYKQTLSREVLPDPKIVAEKYNLVDEIHQYLESKKFGIRDSSGNDKTPNSNNQINSPSAKTKVKKNNSPKENPLPLPWIAAVTAIATLIALALIYIL